MFEQELTQPIRTGKKATVIMAIEVMVEVQESDSWNDMSGQAKELIAKRVIGAKGFHPFRARVQTIHSDVEVEELKYHTEVPQKERWKR